MKNTNILISFVGKNDSGKLPGKSDGAIINIFKSKNFDELHLLCTINEQCNDEFHKIAQHVKKVLTINKRCKNIKIHKIEINNVTDHNEIYHKLLNFCKSLPVSNKRKYVGAIASGTPAMQVCWILMAESEDFDIKLIRTNEPRFGGKLVTEVKLGIGLPTVKRIKNENIKLRKLLPEVILDVKNGRLLIDNVDANLSAMEFSYYRYFVERVKIDPEFEYYTDFIFPKTSIKKVLDYYDETFEDAETKKRLKEICDDKDRNYLISSLRPTFSEIKKKIKKIISSKEKRDFIIISSDGPNNKKKYGIRLPAGKIKIIK